MKAWTWEELREIKEEGWRSVERFVKQYGVRGALALDISTEPGSQGAVHCSLPLQGCWGDDCPLKGKDCYNGTDGEGRGNLIAWYAAEIKKHGRGPEKGKGR
jgi:hypothetical protein